MTSMKISPTRSSSPEFVSGGDYFVLLLPLVPNMHPTSSRGTCFPDYEFTQNSSLKGKASLKTSRVRGIFFPCRRMVSRVMLYYNWGNTNQIQTRPRSPSFCFLKEARAPELIHDIDKAASRLQLRSHGMQEPNNSKLCGLGLPLVCPK